MAVQSNHFPGKIRPVFPSPDLKDLIFVETLNDSGIEIPTEYGQKHHDSTHYPHHVLVYISPPKPSEDGARVDRDWFWAAKRDKQYLYNAEITYPNNGNKRFPQITRTTIELREEYTTDLTVPAMGTADVVYTTATLISEKMGRIPERELDSLFVTVTRIYETIASLDTAADLAELIKFGYRVTYPFAQEAYPRITWTFPAELDDYTPAAKGALCPIDSSGSGGVDYTALKLSDEQCSGGRDGNLAEITRVYDTLPGPTLDTVSKRQPLGIPESFIASATLTREETRKATGATPTTPSGDPVDATSVIESVVQPEGQSHYLDRQTDTKWLITVGNLIDERLDPETGGLITSTQTIVDKPGTSSEVNASGEFTEVRSLGQKKSVEIASTTFDVAGYPLSWETIEHHYWPPVLESLIFAPIEKYIERGGGDTYAAGVYIDWEFKEAYQGPTKVVYTKSWSKTAPSSDTLTAMIPRPMNWQFLRFRGNIPSCLHPAYNLQEIIGNNDPEYPPVAFSKLFAATSYTDWPASLVISSQVRPGNGGFWKIKGVAHKPS